MTRKLLVILFPLILLIFVSSAYAQTSTTGSAQTTNNATSKLRDQIQLIQDQKKTAVADAKAMIQAKRDEFKVKLQTIKDQKKKALVERIDAKLNAMNIKHTDRYTKVLSNLQTILDKISKSATETAILANISTAQNAINSAKLAVENQAAKPYVITISTETALRSDVGIVMSQFRQDLVATHKAVIDAKQAVQGLISVLKGTNAIIREQATSSANL